MFKLSFKVKAGKWHDTVSELRAWKKMDVPAFVQYRARIAVKDLMKWTPPRGKNPGRESYTVQLERGKATIRRDWNRSFRALDQLAAYQTPTGRLSKDFIVAVDNGDVPRITALLKVLGFPYVRGVLSVPSRSIHEAARTKAGTVPVNLGWWVFRQADIDAAAVGSFKDIGKAKSGWGFSAAKLNLPAKHWPAWVRRHGNNGYMQDNLSDRNNPRLYLINDRPEVKDTDGAKMVADALRIGESKLQKELNEILKWAEGKGKIHRKRTWENNDPF